MTTKMMMKIARTDGTDFDGHAHSTLGDRKVAPWRTASSIAAGTVAVLLIATPSAAEPLEARMEAWEAGLEAARNTRLIRSGKFKVSPARTHLGYVRGTGWKDLIPSRLKVDMGSDGVGVHVPVKFVIGARGRWKLWVKPMLSAAMSPTAGSAITPFGKVKVSFASLLLSERRLRPALTISARGYATTGSDYRFVGGRAYGNGDLAAFKQIGKLGLRMRAEYELKKSRSENGLVATRNQLTYAVTAEYRQRKRLELLAELSTTQSFLSGGEQGRGSVPRVTGTLGAGFFAHPAWFLHMNVRYNSDHTIACRPGATFSF